MSDIDLYKTALKNALDHGINAEQELAAFRQAILGGSAEYSEFALSNILKIIERRLKENASHLEGLEFTCQTVGAHMILQWIAEHDTEIFTGILKQIEGGEQ